MKYEVGEKRVMNDDECVGRDGARGRWKEGKTLKTENAQMNVGTDELKSRFPQENKPLDLYESATNTPPHTATSKTNDITMTVESNGNGRRAGPLYWVYTGMRMVEYS